LDAKNFLEIFSIVLKIFYFKLFLINFFSFFKIFSFLSQNNKTIMKKGKKKFVGNRPYGTLCTVARKLEYAKYGSPVLGVVSLAWHVDMTW